MHEYIFQIRLPYSEFMALYKGHVQRVIVLDTLGRTISLPALKFRPFLTQRGVYGRFKLQLNDQGKFISLEPVA